MAINSRWHLQSVIEVAIISIFLGGFFVFSDWLFTLVYGLVTPLGLAPFVGDALFGLWCMGGSLAFMVVRLPGAALISEIVGALLESMFGGTFGIVALFAGFFQGIGTELGFAAFKYKKFNFASLTLAAALSTIVTFTSALFIHGYIHFQLGLLLGLFITRLVSNLIFSVGVVTLVYKLFNRTGLSTDRRIK